LNQIGQSYIYQFRGRVVVKKKHCEELSLGKLIAFLQSGGTIINADSPIAQLYSQSKLATLRRENRVVDPD
jgi:hypothetical protein